MFHKYYSAAQQSKKENKILIYIYQSKFSLTTTKWYGIAWGKMV